MQSNDDRRAQPGQTDEAPTNDDSITDDIKVKMREALASKQGRDRGVQERAHRKEKAPETHGPLGGVHMHRRKAGGGGA